MKVTILGSAQDGGVPHLGCSCDRCAAAREDPSKVRYAASMVVSDETKGVNYLFDVPPGIRNHIGDEFIDGVFLSHAHLGHVTGLLEFGTEAANTESVPVYCSETVEQFLHDNPPYRLLIDRNNIDLMPFVADATINVMGLTVTPVAVENKGYVTTDTNAFVVESPDTTLFYMTDIDEWTQDAVDRVAAADIAIVDGSFWARDELERYENVPHPTIRESMDVLADIDTEIYFTHMNHTNPVIEADSEERAQVEDEGFHVAEEGLELEL